MYWYIDEFLEFLANITIDAYYYLLALCLIILYMCDIYVYTQKHLYYQPLSFSFLLQIAAPIFIMCASGVKPLKC